MSIHAVIDLALWITVLATNATRLRRGVEFVIDHWPGRK